MEASAPSAPDFDALGDAATYGTVQDMQGR